MDVDMHRSARVLVEKAKVAVFPLWGARSNGDCACGGKECSSPMKHPHRLAPKGVYEATTDPDKVDRFWVMGDANIAIATGSISNIIVVDIDPRHGGNESWHNLIKRHGDIDDTWTAVTGGNGYHYYFQYEEGLRNRTGMVPGIDLKTDGGYVVAPPSLHESGNRYEWMAGRKPSTSMQHPAPMPDWLIKLAGGTTVNRERAATVVGKITEGGRNNTLASLAGTMRRRGMEEDEILAALEVVNRNRCDPPLPDKEVGQIAWSIGRLPPYSAEAQAAQWRGNG